MPQVTAVRSATNVPAISDRRSLLSLLVPILFVLIGYSEVMKMGHWSTERVLHWDIVAYYHYLPAVINHNDLPDHTYVRVLEPHIATRDERSSFGISHSPRTGHHHLKFTYGTALFELPFFLIAHAVAHMSGGEYLADGYSAPYQLAVQLSTIFFVALGLLFIRRYLLRYVDDISTAIALCVIAFGTNLYFYSTVNAGMSHGYLFFLVAVILERTDTWHKWPTIQGAFIIGLCAGLVTVMRPVDGLIVLVPLLWNCWPASVFRSKWQLVARHRRHLYLAIVAFVIPILPQLIYWQITTGQLFFYSYTGEGFAFEPANIADGLFSYRKGWIVYSPLVLLGFIGMALMLRRRSTAGPIVPLLIYFPIIITVIFSWEQWWYGGGFGARPLVGSLPLLALPMAWLSKHLVKRSQILWITMLVVIFIGIRLNMFQQHQYNMGMLHWDQMTEERYWEIFLKPNWDGIRDFPYKEGE